ncbi:MAG: hypothetical protein EBZ96_08930, partial [Synechococcaceae bacterium WB9_3_282]|nr:hypothetical protein [Synechococcaceae bacterium WB9_3_282]
QRAGLSTPLLVGANSVGQQLDGTLLGYFKVGGTTAFRGVTLLNGNVSVGVVVGPVGKSNNLYFATQ